MSADAAALPGSLAEEYTARWSDLAGRWAERPGTTLGTLGPDGTSSQLAAHFLAQQHGLSVELFVTFDELLDQLVGRKVDFALVPSAYQGLTRFHWHQDLRLRAFFPQATPEYGIAAPAGAVLGTGDEPVTVAAMWEVRRIYAEVVPAGLRGREVRWVDAVSTQHAAEIVAGGGAELAVTNAPGVRAHGLRWVATRRGAEIVWTLFGRVQPDEVPGPS
uniref:Prephenate dehydratase n=1 Tax=Streptomyces sp. NBC_00008 TaxID=2903610 RepID=A0AAU2VSV6_9ACTN